jgi:hypothetical protein
LREQNKPTKAKDVANLVNEILPNAVGGSIYNLLNRLEQEGYVDKDEDGWWLLPKGKTVILSGGFIWSLPEHLSKQDLAAHRREAIMFILRNERYLQLTEIVEQLHGWHWVKAPVNKDLLKLDLQVLETEGLIRRIGNTRNWEAVARD